MIPGVTDRTRLPRLGKIRLGEKRMSQGGKEYPAALDHFNLADAPGLEGIIAKGGDKPKALPVEFMSDKLDEAFFTSRSCYGKSSGLFCRCSDGVSATRVYVGDKDPQGHAFVQGQGLDVQDGDMFELPCDGPECPFFANGRCKNLGRLRFKVRGQPAFGFYEINTSSYNSIVDVGSVLSYVLTRVGRLMGIPFILRLIEHQAVVQGKAKKVHILQLIPPQDEYLDRLRFKAAALPAAAPLDVVDDVPDDLVPYGGAALDADLGKTPRPETRMEPEPGKSKLDQLAGAMKAPEPEAPPLNDPADLFAEEAPAAVPSATRRRPATARAVAKAVASAPHAPVAVSSPQPTLPDPTAEEAPWGNF